MRTARYPGAPLLYIDEPGDIQKRREIAAQTQAKWPVLYEVELGGKTYRVRGDGNDRWICEWLYDGKWRTVRNREIALRVKEE